MSALDADELDPIAAGTLSWLERTLAQSVQTNVWDASPELGILLRRQTSFGLLCVITPIEIDEVWHVAPVPDVLRAFARALRHRAAPQVLADVAPGWEFAGVSLFTEGWMLSGDVTDRAEMESWTATHNIKDHPDRIEVKMLSAVDRAGMHYLVQHARGAARSETSFVATRGHGDSNELGGRVPEALDSILDALLDAE